VHEKKTEEAEMSKEKEELRQKVQAIADNAFRRVKNWESFGSFDAYHSYLAWFCWDLFDQVRAVDPNAQLELFTELLAYLNKIWKDPQVLTVKGTENDIRERENS